MYLVGNVHEVLSLMFLFCFYLWKEKGGHSISNGRLNRHKQTRNESLYPKKKMIASDTIWFVDKLLLFGSYFLYFSQSKHNAKIQMCALLSYEVLWCTTYFDAVMNRSNTHYSQLLLIITDLSSAIFFLFVVFIICFVFFFFLLLRWIHLDVEVCVKISHIWKFVCGFWTWITIASVCLLSYYLPKFDISISPNKLLINNICIKIRILSISPIAASILLQTALEGKLETEKKLFQRFDFKQTSIHKK